MMGGRRADSSVTYPVNELAARYGASAAATTSDPAEAYADWAGQDAQPVGLAWPLGWILAAPAGCSDDVPAPEQRRGRDRHGHRRRGKRSGAGGGREAPGVQRRVEQLVGQVVAGRAGEAQHDLLDDGGADDDEDGHRLAAGDEP